MLNKKRTIGAIALAATVLMSACGTDVINDGYVFELTENDKKIESAVKNHEFPFAAEGTTLKIGKKQDACVIDFETNKFTKYIEESTGIDLTFDIYADANKLKTMLAADDKNLPEVAIACGMSDDMFVKYGVGELGSGAIIPLDGYIDNYGYYINDALENTMIDGIEKFLTCVDGHRYYMPYICEQQGNVFSGKAWVNKVWLDKLDLDVPQTTDELKSVLEAFRDNDPNGNGKKDEIGITGSKDGYKAIPWQFLMNSFIYCDRDNYYVVDDKGNLTLAYTQPEFKEGLKYMRSLAKDGLYDLEAFSQDNSSLKAVAQQHDNMIGVLVGGSPDNVFSANLERMLDYVPLPNPKGPKGVALSYMQVMKPTTDGWMTKYCKNPLAAFTMMDFMMSEEATLFARYGEKGVDWVPATDKDIPLLGNIGIGAVVVPILGYGEVSNAHWQAHNPQFRSSKIADGMAWNGKATDGEKIKADAITSYYGKGPGMDHLVRDVKFKDLDDFDEYSSLSADIKAYVNNSVAEFISGTRDIDKDWDAFQSELKTLGVDRFLELAQLGYDTFERK